MEHLPGKENVLADRLSRWQRHEETINKLDKKKERVVRLHEVLAPVWGSRPLGCCAT